MTNLAIEESKHSHCVRLNVGAILVDSYTGDIITSCHNRPAKNHVHICNDSGCIDIIHAETLVILSSRTRDMSKCTMYVTHEPCYYCAKLIVESGISCVVFEKEYVSKTGHTGGLDLLSKSNVCVVQYIRRSVDNLVTHHTSSK
ncbi:MAG: hypothetical protein HC773_01415 [Scytonema sp. CRU_2_7]|nr:hypothetical protein [Scytonema sp. CRU_2_7]